MIALAVTVGTLIFCPMLGYALAKLRWHGKGLVMALVLATLMVPAGITLIPNFILMSNLGLVNTYPGLILPFLAGPFGVFLMRQFMLGVPDELLEAARMDGANEFKVFWSVVMPIATPVLATLAILTFLGNWNSFLYPLVMAQEPADVHAPRRARHVRDRPVPGGSRNAHGGLGDARRAGPDRVRPVPALDHRRHRHDRAQGLTTARPFPS